jgi:hypothetical protein
MAVNHVAIDRLRLDEAFTTKMLHKAFNECWSVKCDELLLVVDDDESKVSRFGTACEDVEKGLLVFNEQKREIILLSIDNQLLKGVQGGVADCALFDDKQFRFVEFKMNAEGRSLKAAHNAIEKAEQQLKNTIRIFSEGEKNVNVDFENAVTLSCHVVLSRTFPATQSAIQNYQMTFAAETGIYLSFDSETLWEESEK